MSRFNSSLARLLPVIPKSLIRPFSKPYVAGETEDEAMEAVSALNESGFTVTLDILGEHVESEQEADDIFQAYSRIYDRLALEHLDCNISLKLTHLGLDLDKTQTRVRLIELANKAKEHGNFLRIDMENSPYTDTTIQMYQDCLQVYEQIGLVFQTYLKRTLDDIRVLDAPNFNARICKGIYRESPEIAYQDRQEIRDQFIASVQLILNGQGYAAIATHDLFLIDTLETWIQQTEIPKERYEFQVLYGVPMGDRLERLKEAGHKVRIYVPFGPDWYKYSLRRLKENPQIISYVLGNMFKNHS